MPTYAADTSVSSEQSRAEIERTLRRYGATHFGYAFDPTGASVAFVVHGRQVRFRLVLPDANADEFTQTPGRKLRRTATAQAAAYDQAVRQRWRALALVIKAKLEAVEAGIVGFDEEFLAQLVLPNGRTVAEEAGPQIRSALESGVMPALMPGMTAGA
jgi:hypothetical protein